MENVPKRGRPATGSPVWFRERWHIRVTLPGGNRPYYPIEPYDKPATLGRGDIDRARVIAAQVVPVLLGRKRLGEPDPNCVEKWLGRWLERREADGLRSVDTDKSRIKHINEVIGGLPMNRVGRSDIERLVASLDKKIADGMSWKTARNVWVLLTKAFDDAISSKDTTLRCIETSPCEKVRPPNGGDEKAKGYLYPSEFMKLVSTEKIPLKWRRVYALAIYLYARRGELVALTRGDIDLEHMTVLIHSAADEAGSRRSTKGRRSRRVPIEPNLLPLLKTMIVDMRPEDTIMNVYLGGSNGQCLAERFREHLTMAGVTRTELHAPKDDATRKNVTFHDLRATGITWAAVRGDDPLKIMQRAGHRSFATTQRYVREADNIRYGFGEPFPALPEGLL